jgi:hypothetical protein
MPLLLVVVAALAVPQRLRQVAVVVPRVVARVVVAALLVAAALRLRPRLQERTNPFSFLEAATLLSHPPGSSRRVFFCKTALLLVRLQGTPRFFAGPFGRHETLSGHYYVRCRRDVARPRRHADAAESVARAFPRVGHNRCRRDDINRAFPFRTGSNFVYSKYGRRRNSTKKPLARHAARGRGWHRRTDDGGHE